MIITVGTFNLNNLFSRFNFKAVISNKKKADNTLTVEYKFSDKNNYRIRSFKGKLVKAKKLKKSDMINI